ncbi:selenocysteine-specific translation elongation factor [endosymbiont 'TC1' of Trimyema compressum]|uniref:selenocysteine-specific translation elongation factor n=1 Tax=endosymbiont 'TC1' of Trimyema compressum TaxID=243899 RepID=UPI000ADCF195|nr:selenocysteine-specific translation elongation factor [endosymbiont 'TC1' of Trimyema compressum]
MSFYIVGTAGHIDHGKTELSKTLTGIMTDRLKEEQNRGISIQLGFAPLVLSDGSKVGLVDVPGHERFIRQMLAGVGGMDIILLVIAADEGIMPQTKEHLDIANLLGIKNLIVVLTKKDLVDDEWLELVKDDIKIYLEERGYKNTPIIAVDSISKTGINDLKAALNTEIKKLPTKEKGVFPRLPIDRAFSLTGFGTIITGTLWSGEIKVGDTLELLPHKKQVKVRNIQVHGEDKPIAEAGQRVALNIPDIAVKDVVTGSLLIKEHFIKPTYKIVTYFSLLGDKKALKNRQKVRLYLGTTEVLGRLILLENDSLESGNSMFCAFYLDKAINCTKGDRIIVRTQTPMETIGGATIIDTEGKHIKRKNKEYIQLLERKMAGSPEETFLDSLIDTPMATKESLSKLLEMSIDSILELIENCGDEVILIKNNYLAKSTYDYFKNNMMNYINQYLEKHPLRQGVPKEEIRTKVFSSLTSKEYNNLLFLFEEKEGIMVKGDSISLVNYKPIINEKTASIIQKIERLYAKDGFNTRSLEEYATLLKINKKDLFEYIQHLQQQEIFIKIGEELFLLNTVFAANKEKIINFIKKEGSIKLSEARDILDSSRKYVLPFLEYLDYKKITKRQDDVRILF